jgi:hypothetical protein
MNYGTKVINVSGVGQFNRSVFATTLSDYSRAGISKLLRDIAVRETDNQIKLNNPPSLIYIDGRTSRTIDQVQKKIEVIFGSVLPAAAMRAAEVELIAAIKRSTETRTGKLSDISNWEWVYVSKSKGGASRKITASDAPVMTHGDRVILKPKNIPYVTFANMTANSSGANSFTTKRKGVSRTHSRGFMGATSRKLNKLSMFKNFRALAGFTVKFKAAGERSDKYGTPYLLIMPSKRRGQ